MDTITKMLNEVDQSFKFRAAHNIDSKPVDEGLENKHRVTTYHIPINIDSPPKDTANIKLDNVGFKTQQISSAMGSSHGLTTSAGKLVSDLQKQYESSI